MRPHGVVVNSPGFDDLLRLRDAEKPVLVQALITKLSIEALDMGVLDRFARANKAQLDPTAVRATYPSFWMGRCCRTYLTNDGSPIGAASLGVDAATLIFG